MMSCSPHLLCQVQPAVMRELREAVVVAPVKVQQVFLPILRRSIQESDNWIFKVTWVRWYQRLVADCRAGGAFELVML